MVVIILTLGLEGITDRHRDIFTHELCQGDLLSKPACVPHPGRESVIESPGNVSCVLKKKYAIKEENLPEDLLEKLIEGATAQDPAVIFVIGLEVREDRLEGHHLDVFTPVVKVGDLVRYVPPHYNVSEDLGALEHLVGLVVKVEEDGDRVKVFWQKYNVYKLVELAHLEILKK